MVQMGENSPFACRAWCRHLTVYWTRCTWRTLCTALKRHVVRLSSVTTLRHMTSSKLPPLITALDAYACHYATLTYWTRWWRCSVRSTKGQRRDCWIPRWRIEGNGGTTFGMTSSSSYIIEGGNLWVHKLPPLITALVICTHFVNAAA